MVDADAEEIERFVRLGSVLAGKYRIERVLGVGGMGVVVAAQHLQLGETVAIKFLLPRVLGSRKGAQRFLREARASSRLKSPSVTRVFDTDVRDDGAAFIVMEYLDGESFSTRLRREPRLSSAATVDIVLEACTALAEAHARGIVHRDLKPANLFIARSAGNLKLIKVLDFGISKLLEPGSETDHTTGDSVMGSPPYMSPEQLLQPTSVDHRTDIWSLGVVLYEALTGKRPFVGASFAETCARILQTDPPGIAELEPSLPIALDAIVRRCLRKNAALRFPSVLSFAQALVPFGSERATSSLHAIEAIAASESSGMGPERASRSAPAPEARPGDRSTTSTSEPEEAGTLTAAAHSGRPARPSTHRLAAVLMIGAVALAAWFGARLLSSNAASDRGSSRTAAVSAVSVGVAPTAGPLRSATPVSVPPTASAAAHPPIVQAVRPKDKRVIAALTPSSSSAVTKPPPVPSTPEAPSRVDSVFGERH